MSFSKIRQNFIDRTARKPHGDWAKKTNNDPKAHYRSFEIILDKLQLSTEDSYIETGCGGGVLLEKALNLAARVAAIDHSVDMIETATQKLTKIDPDRYDLKTGDAAALPWEDNRFNTAASANMFFFVEKPQEVLNEINRVLKPGGRFAMVTMSKGILGKITFGWLYSLKTYSDTEMKSMLEQADFTNIEVTSSFNSVQVCYAEKLKKQ